MKFQRTRINNMTAFRQWLADKLQRLAEILRGGIGGPGEE
jgi:hypothetical protein